MNLKLHHFVIPSLVIFVLMTGYFITQSGMYWYETDLILPNITPPKGFFSVVWSILGILTTLSLFAMWNSFKRNTLFFVTIFFFIINGILNVLWTIFFFSYHQIYNAYIVAALLEINLIILIGLLAVRSKKAALLLVPYALWVGFAIYLNYQIYLLNEAL